LDILLKANLTMLPQVLFGYKAFNLGRITDWISFWIKVWQRLNPIYAAPTVANAIPKSAHANTKRRDRTHTRYHNISATIAHCGRFASAS